MGNSQRAGHDHWTHNQIAKGMVGQPQLTGRYHRAPKKLEDDYLPNKKKVLGSGYNGEVFLATHKDTGLKYAVKNFKTTGVGKDKLEELQSECEIFLTMDHPHVARLVDVYESTGLLSLVMECMEGGELFQRVLAKKRFGEQEAKGAVWQMLLSVNYLHSHNVVHRDLKLENFLYETEKSDHLKLIDFGFSKLWDKNTKMDLSCGTLAYVAPEVLQKSYTNKCDMWSLGVITFILLVGYMPFHGNEESQIKHIKECKYTLKPEKWKNVSKVGLSFVQSCLQKDPIKRMSAPAALEHAWIKEQDQKERADHHDDVNQETVDALCNFAQASAFKRAAMQVMAWSLTNEERAKVRDAFIELDVDRTGAIKLVDLKRCLSAEFHITDDKVAEVFNSLDSSHTEEIHYSDFLSAMCSNRIKLHDHLLKDTFKRFDTDNSGFITNENLKEVLGETMSAEEMQKMIQEVDSSGDGKISYDEFIEYLKHGDHDAEHAEIAHKVIDKQLEKGAPSSPAGSNAPPTLKAKNQDSSPAEAKAPTENAEGPVKAEGPASCGCNCAIS